MKNTISHKVKFGETDMAGIVFYPNFYKWMDYATGELFDSNYRSISNLINEEQIYFPLLETRCNFFMPLFFENKIQIISEVVEWSNKTFKVVHTFKRDTEVIASGYEVRAWAKKINDKLKTVPIPEELKSKSPISN